MSERKKRRWLWPVGIVVTVGLLAGAGEWALRLIIPSVVQSQLREQLGLAADHPVEVELGGSTLLNALRGGVGDATISSDGVPIIDGFRANAVVHVDFTPFNPVTGRIDGAVAALTVPKKELGPAIDLLTQGVADTGRVEGDDLVVGRGLEVFGQDVGIEASLHIGVGEPGFVTVEPRGLKAAGFDMDADELGSATGKLLEPILKPQVICIADQLPRGIELTDIDLSRSGAVTLRAKLSPTILSDPNQQQPGSCE